MTMKRGCIVTGMVTARLPDTIFLRCVNPQCLLAKLFCVKKMKYSGIINYIKREFKLAQKFQAKVRTKKGA